MTKAILGGRRQAHSFVVAAPVRSAAPVRRHHSLMSGLDQPRTRRDLRCENFLYCYQAGVRLGVVDTSMLDNLSGRQPRWQIGHGSQILMPTWPRMSSAGEDGVLMMLDTMTTRWRRSRTPLFATPTTTI